MKIKLYIKNVINLKNKIKFLLKTHVHGTLSLRFPCLILSLGEALAKLKRGANVD